LFVGFSLFLSLLCFPSPLTLPFQISPLLLLQARKYSIAHSTGTITAPRTMMGRQKKWETSFPIAKNYYRNQREMKKADTQTQTPTKWR
jgi:hypothetical protein